MTTSHLLPKKRGVLNKHPKISFLRVTPFGWSLTVVTPPGMSRAKLRIRLK